MELDVAVPDTMTNGEGRSRSMDKWKCDAALPRWESLKLVWLARVAAAALARARCRDVAGAVGCS